VSPAGPRSGDREPTSIGSLMVAVSGFFVLALLYLESARVSSPTAMQRILGDLGFLGLVFFVTGLAVIAALRARGPERRLWVLVTCTYVVLLVSELYWVWIIAATGTPPPPVYAPFQALHTVAALLYLGVVGSLTPLAGTHRLVRVRQLLDVVSFGIVVYVIAFFLSVTPFFAGVQGTTPGDALVGAVYPTWAVLMLAGLAWPMLASSGRHRHGRWERFLGTSLALYAVALAAWPLWFVWAMELSASGQQAILDVLQMLSHYLLMLALVVRLRQPGKRWTPPRADANPRPVARAASYAMVAFVMVAMPIMIALALSAPEGSLTRSVLAAASAGLALLTVARTVLTSIESGRLFRSSMTDPLTGLHNHRHFHEQLRTAVDVAGRFAGTVAVVALDLDGFDEVNDRHGHPAGDELLRQVGVALRDACGSGGVMCRVGGDEFACVLPGADAETALQVAVRARRGLAEIATPDGTPITVSSGIALYPTHATDAETLVRLADGAAYWVKRHGKDHALVFDPTVVTELSPDDLVKVVEHQAESGIVRALAAAVDARHEFTSTHSVAVSVWATDVARRLGLSEDRIRTVETAALLHDVGMIAVSGEVFDKPEPLSDGDLEQLRTHPELGERIVAGTMPKGVVAVIRHHHEHWDGSGYPDGLRAVAIPLEARILHVCGAYDAMTSPRSFRPAMSVATAIVELRAGAGTQFDPEVVDEFLAGLGPLGPLPENL